jgi:hypothetical protein
MSESRDKHLLRRLNSRLPLTTRWFEGPTAPPVGPKELVFWEDTVNNVAKILVKKSDKTYTFTSDT